MKSAAHTTRLNARSEAAVVKELYASLLRQRYVNRKGVEKPMGSENILVVVTCSPEIVRV